jgi:hypothetical protein
MANRRNLVIVAAVLAMAAALAGLLPLPRAARASPIAFHFDTNGELHDSGNIWFGRTFWVTNNTSKAVMVTIVSIEIKDGSNWNPRSLFSASSSRMLEFRLLRSRPGLGPHQAGLADLDTSVPYISRPSGTTWRAIANVQEELTGIQRVWAAIQMYVQDRRFSGAPNPLSGTVTYWSKPTMVVSQELVEP